MIVRVKSLGRWVRARLHADAEERDRRSGDVLHSWGQVAIVASLIAGAVWLNNVSDHVTHVGQKQGVQTGHISDAQQSLDRQQTAIKAEAVKLGQQRQSLINGCQRLNQLRAEDNTSHLGLYTLFVGVIALSQSGTQQVPASQRSAYNSYLDSLRASAAAQSWTPMTNCEQTIAAQGADYQLPNPISFTARKPPKSALELPKGGVGRARTR